MPVTLPESADPIVAPSICVKYLESNSVELHDIVISRASKIQAVLGFWYSLVLSSTLTASIHFSVLQLG